MVAGDVTEEEVLNLAQRTYGQIPARGKAPVRFRRREPEPWAARHITVADPKVEQPTVQRLYLTPSSRTSEGGDAQALEVLAEIMGGGATSYLYRKLVLDQGVAVNAGAWYMASAMEETRFSLYAIPAEGISPENLEAAIDAAIANLAAEAFSDQAIEQAKTRLIAETVYSSDSQSSMARIFGAGLAIGETIADILRWPRDIEAVTREELQSVARRFLTLNRSVTGYLIKKTD